MKKYNPEKNSIEKNGKIIIYYVCLISDPSIKCNEPKCALKKSGGTGPGVLTSVAVTVKDYDPWMEDKGSWFADLCDDHTFGTHIFVRLCGDPRRSNCEEDRPAGRAGILSHDGPLVCHRDARHFC